MPEAMEDFLEYIKVTRASSSNTIASYQRDLKLFCSFMQQRTNGELPKDPENIKDFVEFLRNEKRSESSIIRVLSSVRSYYNFLVLNNIMKTNPAKSIKMKHIEKKLPEILTDKEINLLLSLPDSSDTRGCRDKAILELIYATGMKVSELVNLDASDINLKNATISYDGKVLPLYSLVLHALSYYILNARALLDGGNKETALFLNVNGKRMTRQGIWKIIKNYSSLAGIQKDITPYTLRHSFAAHLMQNGANAQELKDIMGFADVSSVNVYEKIVKNNINSSYTKFHPRAIMK